MRAKKKKKAYTVRACVYVRACVRVAIINEFENPFCLAAYVDLQPLRSALPHSATMHVIIYSTDTPATFRGGGEGTSKSINIFLQQFGCTHFPTSSSFLGPFLAALVVAVVWAVVVGDSPRPD